MRLVNPLTTYDRVDLASDNNYAPQLLKKPLLFNKIGHVFQRPQPLLQPRHVTIPAQAHVHVPSWLTTCSYTSPYTPAVHQIPATIANFNKCSESALPYASKPLKRLASDPQPDYPHHPARTTL